MTHLLLGRTSRRENLTKVLLGLACLYLPYIERRWLSPKAVRSSAIVHRHWGTFRVPFKTMKTQFLSEDDLVRIKNLQ